MAQKAKSRSFIFHSVYYLFLSFILSSVQDVITLQSTLVYVPGRCHKAVHDYLAQKHNELQHEGSKSERTFEPSVDDEGNASCPKLTLRLQT